MKWLLPKAFLALLLGFLVSSHYGYAASQKHNNNKAAINNSAIASQLDQFWQKAKRESYKTPEELKAQQQWEQRKGYHYAKLMHGRMGVHEVALTFDDGPHPQYTPKILAILRKYHVKATFFVVGEMAAKQPELIRAEAADGHVVGNHTYHHVNLTKIPDSSIPIEWQAAQDVIKGITGKSMRFCRPPGGDYDGEVMKDATDLGLVTVLWTDDPGDYASPGDKAIKRRVLSRIDDGGIILIHDGIQQTIDVLPQIIENLKKRGFRFVTVSEMYNEIHGGSLPIPVSCIISKQRTQTAQLQRHSK